MKKGFTLIELLIVVAIIAILAAIAVPNFLEAQVRAKISRAKSDIRTIVTGLELYRVDNNKYAPDCYGWDKNPFGGPNYEPRQCIDQIKAIWYANSSITTPIAYLTTADLVDPFNVSDAALRNYRYTNWPYTYTYVLNSATALPPYVDLYGDWRVSSDGPDRVYSRNTNVGATTPSGLPMPFNGTLAYDATNGTVSAGDIIRSQKQADQAL